MKKASHTPIHHGNNSEPPVLLSRAIPGDRGGHDLSDIQSQLLASRNDNDALRRQVKRMEKVQKKADLEAAQELNIARDQLEETTKLFENGKRQHWELQKHNVRFELSHLLD